MSPDESRGLLTRLIGEIAPDVDLAALTVDDDLGETLDLDSMGLLNLVTAVSESIGRDIPDADPARLRTLGDWQGHLADVCAT